MDGVDCSLCLRIGQNVIIRRTDGRIHSAIIDAIDTTNRSVIVYWFENGETKGKEIDFGIVFKLNPDLLKFTVRLSNGKNL